MPAHPHAKLMALYAKDATETDKPWERWECYDPNDRKWKPIYGYISWIPTIKYRRKPERRWYRVALFISKEDGLVVTTTQDSQWAHLQTYESTPNFVKWLTDRVYYDVE